MHLNVFTQCTPSPPVEGQWRNPADPTVTGYRQLSYWTELARKLESACVDALFFADVHGIYDVYRGSWAPALEHAVQIPAVDPMLVIPAAAAVTEHLGFAVTFSTTYHAPYECARVFSSLDHFTDGRIAWNIVTSYLGSAEANGLGEHLAHDLRYDRGDEYMEVVRALWERSWDDDAVVCDRAAGVFVDPTRVRQIDHRGQWYTVRGPHQCEPSPQRTPVLYQAGDSDRGMTFAARHAEVAFLTLADPEAGRAKLADLRRRVIEQGRAPDAVKALQGMPVMVGRTKEEAKAKADLFMSLVSHEGMLTKWCGWMGIDLAAYPDDAPVGDIRSEGSRGLLGFLARIDPERAWTVADVRRIVAVPPRVHLRRMLYGTPEKVADRMEEWLEVSGIDGFNLFCCPPASGVEDVCDLLIPELQRRGLFRTAYDPGERTLRERYFGTGRARLPYEGAEPALAAPH
ncbi:MAG: LLM class flavin-dependent oxidoreductase [Actinobacteria bacterium]|nr:LLM class flavin-dependent oxidoreductase [Actinomycetota bacterium]